jgi:hypothetical protein
MTGLERSRRRRDRRKHDEHQGMAKPNPLRIRSALRRRRNSIARSVRRARNEVTGVPVQCLDLGQHTGEYAKPIGTQNAIRRYRCSNLRKSLEWTRIDHVI